MTVLEAARWELMPMERRAGTESIVGEGRPQSVCQATTVIDSAAAVLEVDASVPSGLGETICILPSTYTELFWHFKFQFDAVPTATGSGSAYRIASFGHIHSGGFVSSHYAMMMKVERTAGGTGELCIHGAADNNDVRYRAAISAATTYRFEVRVKLISVAPSLDERGLAFVEVKQDSTLIASFYVWHIIVDDLNGATFGMDTGLAIGTKGYYSAYWVNDTAGSVNKGWPGELTFVSLTPDGNGSNMAYDAWSKSTGTVGDDLIDEAPDANDHIRVTATNLKQAWTMTTATVSGIRGLSFVFDPRKARVSGAATANIGYKILIWDGAEYATAEYLHVDSQSSTFATGSRGKCLVFETQPSDASAWDQTTIDALEVGVHSQTHDDAGWRNILYAQRTYVVTGTEVAADNIWLLPMGIGTIGII